MKGQKRKIFGTVGVLAVFAVAMTVYKTTQTDGVVDVYKHNIKAKLPPQSKLSAQMKLDALMLANILKEVDALEKGMVKMNKTFLVSKNLNKGLFTVEQEHYIAQAFSRYLMLRRALFHVAFRYKDYATIEDQSQQDNAFLLAYTAGMTLYRNGVILVMMFREQEEARKKLNEAHPALNVPAGTLDEIYKNITTPANVQLALSGVADFEERHKRLKTSNLLKVKGLDGVLGRLTKYEKELEAAYTKLAEGKRDILWARLTKKVQDPAYKTQTFVSVMIGHIRTPLHGKGLSPENIQKQIQPKLQPGDILLSRRDGYLSNTFLPGNWGHAAMYMGTTEQIRALGKDKRLEVILKDYADKNDKDGRPYAVIEAIGEGVRYSSLPFALKANMIAVVRPNVSKEAVITALIRAHKLLGTPYDFSFDLSSQDKIICTELVYRAYAPFLETTLEEVMGRKTLKPDGFLRALDPTASTPKSTFVMFGRSNGGRFEPKTVNEMMQTVKK